MASSSMAVSRIKREFKEVMNSQEVRSDMHPATT